MSGLLLALALALLVYPAKTYVLYHPEFIQITPRHQPTLNNFVTRSFIPVITVRKPITPQTQENALISTRMNLEPVNGAYGNFYPTQNQQQILGDAVNINKVYQNQLEQPKSVFVSSVPYDASSNQNQKYYYQVNNGAKDGYLLLDVMPAEFSSARKTADSNALIQQEGESDDSGHSEIKYGSVVKKQIPEASMDTADYDGNRKLPETANMHAEKISKALMLQGYLQNQSDNMQFRV